MSTFGAPGRSRETTEAEWRERARERVRRAARAGRSPRERFSDDDLAYAFTGHQEELEQLEQLAADVVARRRGQRRSIEQSRALQYETEKVLAEWDQERRTKAEAEARRRLGMEPTP